MQLKMDINRKDYADYNFHFYKKHFRSYTCLAFLLTLLFWFDHFKQPIQWGTVIIGMIVTAAIIFIMLIVYVFFSAKNYSKLLLEDGWVLGKSTFTFNNEEILVESKHSTTSLKWSAIKYLEENKNAVFLYVDTIAVYIFPKRCFDNDSQINAFKDMVLSHIKDNNPHKTLT